MTWGGGSSGASPKTAGACALLIQWWRRHNAGQEPSPAMLRALLVNGAQPMGSGGPVPNPREGWGRLNLDTILAPQTRRVLADQETLLGARGDTQEWLVRLADPKQPLKVTLAWTDPPGAVGTGTATASAVVNKLALRVEAGGRTYRGNQFQHGWSLAGGAPDREGWDNLQNVFLPAGEASGLVRVTVAALEITTNCLTNRPDTPQQDFALVITNALPEKSVTPTEVVVVVDPAATGAARADDGDDFWAPDADVGADAGDLAELDGEWWDARDGADGAGPLDGDTDDASWWNEAGEVQWPEEEAVRPQPGAMPPAENPDLRWALDVGTSVVSAGMEGNVVLAGGGRRAAERGARGLAGAGTRPLSLALESALAQPAGRTPLGAAVPAPRARAAVVVVGSGTRVTRRDLDVLRSLAFQGDLYLVSQSAPVLAFLAQRIHRLLGVHCRLADDASSLAALVRETLVEAGGGQQVEAPPPAAGGADGATLVYRFSVISADRRLVVRIPSGPDGAAPRVALQRPGETRPAALSAPSGAGASGSSLRLSPHGDALQLDAAAGQQEPWAGEWRLHVGYGGAAGGEAEPSRIAVWAWSGLRVDVRQREVGAPEPGAGECDQSRVLLTFDGAGSASLSRCEVQPRRIAAGAGASPPQTEAERRLDLRPRSPRESEEVAGREPQAPALGALVRLTRPAAGAAVLDLPMRVTGTDPLGHPFARRLRGDVLLLEPRSAWRRRLAPGRRIVLTAARIAEAIYEDGRVPSGLILEQGTRRRPVRIPEGGLRARLAGLLRREEASGAGLRFAVMGHELTAVVSLLGAVRSGAAEPAEAAEPVESRVEDSP